MSKLIKPLLNADGTQWITPIYYEEKWKPKEEECYYLVRYWDNGEVAFSHYYPDIYYSDKLNIEISNCFRTKEEAEQADIQQILDNLKEYYKNKEGK